MERSNYPVGEIAEALSIAVSLYESIDTENLYSDEMREELEITILGLIKSLQVTKGLKDWEVKEYNIESPKGTEMSVTYGINSVPSTVIIVDGKEPRKLIGTLSAADLAKELV